MGIFFRSSDVKSLACTVYPEALISAMCNIDVTYFCKEPSGSFARIGGIMLSNVPLLYTSMPSANHRYAISVFLQFHAVAVAKSNLLSVFFSAYP